MTAKTRRRVTWQTMHKEEIKLARILGPNGHYVYLLHPVEDEADRSYGIEVAKLAGIPGAVTQRAREILKKHEENEHQLSDNLTVRAKRKPKIIVNQLSLFTALEEELRNNLRQVDVDRLTPLEALGVLAELKKKAENTL